jgi:hypothetical protein
MLCKQMLFKQMLYRQMLLKQMFVELMLPKQMLFYKNAAKNAQLHIQGVVLAEPCLKLPGKAMALPIYMPASFKNSRPACKEA